MRYLSQDGIKGSSADIMNLLDPKESLGRFVPDEAFVADVVNFALDDLLDRMEEGLADLLLEMSKHVVQGFVEGLHQSSVSFRRRHRLHNDVAAHVDVGEDGRGDIIIIGGQGGGEPLLGRGAGLPKPCRIVQLSLWGGGGAVPVGAAIEVGHRWRWHHEEPEEVCRCSSFLPSIYQFLHRRRRK